MHGRGSGPRGVASYPAPVVLHGRLGMRAYQVSVPGLPLAATMRTKGGGRATSAATAFTAAALHGRGSRLGGALPGLAGLRSFLHGRASATERNQAMAAVATILHGQGKSRSTSRATTFVLAFMRTKTGGRGTTGATAALRSRQNAKAGFRKSQTANLYIAVRMTSKGGMRLWVVSENWPMPPDARIIVLPRQP